MKGLKGLAGLIGAGVISLGLCGDVKGEGMLQIENHLGSNYPDLKLIHYDDPSVSDGLDGNDSEFLLPPEGYPGIYSDIGSDKLSMDYRNLSSDTPFDIRLVYEGELTEPTPNWFEISMPYPGWEFENKDFLTLTQFDSLNGDITEQYNVREFIEDGDGVGRIDLPDISPGVYDTGTPYAYFTLGFNEFVFPPEHLVGDLNLDGIIDGEDVGIVGGGFGMGAGYWDVNTAGLGDGDVNGDGRVDILDVRSVAENYGMQGNYGVNGNGAVSSNLEGVVGGGGGGDLVGSSEVIVGGVDYVHGVPEPSGDLLLLIGSMALGAWGLRRLDWC